LALGDLEVLRFRFGCDPAAAVGLFYQTLVSSCNLDLLYGRRVLLDVRGVEKSCLEVAIIGVLLLVDLLPAIKLARVFSLKDLLRAALGGGEFEERTSSVVAWQGFLGGVLVNISVKLIGVDLEGLHYSLSQALPLIEPLSVLILLLHEILHKGLRLLYSLIVGEWAQFGTD